MRISFYALAIKNPTNPKASVFFIGWVPVEGSDKLEPRFGPPHEDGCRNVVLFPHTSIAQLAITDLPVPIQSRLTVVEFKMEDV